MVQASTSKNSYDGFPLPSLGNKDWLAFIFAPIAAVGLHLIAVAVMLSGALVSMDYIVFMAASYALVSIAVFGRAGWLEDRYAGSLSPFGLFVLITCLFLISIFDSFQLKLTNGTFMFGFVPWSDAEAYLPGGWQMLVDGTLNEWHQRRPINASVMELRLLLTGINLHAFVLLNSAILGVATTYAAIEVNKHVGAIATALFVIVVFGYSQPYTPSFLSEVLGLALGLVAFGTLMRSCRLGSVWLFAIGSAILSFALNARAGTYFVLPAVWLWGAIYLGKTWRTRAIAGALGAIGLLSGFVYSLMMIKLFGSGEMLTYNANFGDTFYGLARGGIGWHSAQDEHPELYSGVGAAERAAELFRLSFIEIAKYPLRFITVLLGEIREAFISLMRGPHPRLVDGSSPPSVFARMFFVLNLIGLFGILRYPFDRRNALLLLVGLGFFASIPFIWQDGGPRVLVATIPFLLMLMPIGLRIAALLLEGRGLQDVRHFLSGTRSSDLASERAQLIAPATILVGLVLVPFVLGGSARGLGEDIPRKQGASCPPGTKYLRFDRNRLMYVMRVHQGDRHILHSSADMTFGELQATLSPLHIYRLLKNLPAPYTVFGVMTGGKSHRNLLTIIWNGQLKVMDAQDAWHVCLGEFPHEFTGYRGHVYFIDREP
jgi:hypothetical protein